MTINCNKIQYKTFPVFHYASDYTYCLFTAHMFHLALKYYLGRLYRAGTGTIVI